MNDTFFSRSTDVKQMSLLRSLVFDEGENSHATPKRGWYVSCKSVVNAQFDERYIFQSIEGCEEYVTPTELDF